jgi:hypothetical protein
MKSIDEHNFVYQLRTKTGHTFSDTQHIIIPIGGIFSFDNATYQVIDHQLSGPFDDDDDDLYLYVVAEEIDAFDTEALFNALLRDNKLNDIL